jgi:hypothetical protein
VTFQEGQASWNGTIWPADEGWAVFRANIQLAQGQAVAAGDAGRAVAAIEFFKPVRAWLDSLWFVAAPLTDLVQRPLDTIVSIFSQADTAPVARDALEALAWPLADTRTVAPFYDGRYRHTGITYGANEPAVADSGVTVNGTPIASRV